MCLDVSGYITDSKKDSKTKNCQLTSNSIISNRVNITISVLQNRHVSGAAAEAHMQPDTMKSKIYESKDEDETETSTSNKPESTGSGARPKTSAKQSSVDEDILDIIAKSVARETTRLRWEMSSDAEIKEIK